MTPHVNFLESIHSCVMWMNIEIAWIIIFEICIVPEPATTSGTVLATTPGPWHRYSWWSYSSMLPYLLSCPLSDQPLSCLSCMGLSILGLAVLFLSLVCPHLAFLLCAPLSFSSHGFRPLQSFLGNFLGCSHHSCPSNCVHFWSYPSLSLHTSMSASSSHLLLVVHIVPSLLPRSLHHTTELAWPQFCILFPSVSLASSCHTTLHCISSSLSMLHSL